MTRLVRELMQCAPRWTLGILSTVVVLSFVPAATAWVLRELVNQFSRCYQTGSWDWALVGPSLLLMAGLIGGAETLRVLLRWMRREQAERLKQHLMSLLQRKGTEVDLAFWENPLWLDRLHQARAEATYRAQGLVEGFSVVLQAGLSLVWILLLLLPYGWWLVCILLLGSVPAMWVAWRAQVRERVLRQQSATASRRESYFDQLLLSRLPAPEVRMFALGDWLHQCWRELREEQRAGQLTVVKKNLFEEWGAAVLGLIGMGMVLGLMAGQVLAGQRLLGDLALFYQVFVSAQQGLRQLFDGGVRTYQGGAWLEPFFQVLDYATARKEGGCVASGLPVLNHGIRFHEVSFVYPGDTQKVLASCSLLIPAGKVTVVLGKNGSGKSTLVKLLSGLYEPTEGEICWDEVNFRTIKAEVLRSKVRVLWQEPMRYEFTVRQNITLAQPLATDQLEWAMQAADFAGVCSKLPLGWEQPLGKAQTGGQELSAGEWQRLALARTLGHPGDLVILDEPTSALDPWAEAEWMSRLQASQAGRTVIVITHRLAVAQRADHLILLEQGRVVEQGRPAASTFLAKMGNP